MKGYHPSGYVPLPGKIWENSYSSPERVTMTDLRAESIQVWLGKPSLIGFTYKSMGEGQSIGARATYK